MTAEFECFYQIWFVVNNMEFLVNLIFSCTLSLNIQNVFSKSTLNMMKIEMKDTHTAYILGLP